MKAMQVGKIERERKMCLCERDREKRERRDREKREREERERGERKIDRYNIYK